MKSYYHFKVKWGDTDAAGIVFYPNFHKWMDESTHEFFKAIGFPTRELAEQENIMLPIVEAHCQFKSPARFDDAIEVITSVEEVRTKVFKISHIFQSDSIKLAEGYEIRAWTSFLNEKPKAVSIPEKMKEAMLKGYVIS